MPITPKAKQLAKSFRRMYNNGTSPVCWAQVQAGDGRHHWLSLSRDDIKTLHRDQDLQAVCQCMLINRGFIER